jgi:ADP-ribose pyrophosphatase YjhB (NUDIX family)
MATTDRRFAAFSRDSREGLGIAEIPEDGFCISAFLIIRQSDNPRRILMGYLNPNANWAHLGALTSDRIEAHSKGWMLPSCHLLYGEAPKDAATRIAKEQLRLANTDQLHLSDQPKVYSEVYSPKRHPERKQHWDLEFVFEGCLNLNELYKLRTSAWLRLEFVDIDTVNAKEIARSHDDILARL